MSTPEKVRKLANDFDREYPDELNRRLEWWARKLGIDPVRFLRLLDLPPQEIQKRSKRPVDWNLIAERWSENASWVETLLIQLLGQFDYDTKAFAEFLHQGSRFLRAKEAKRIRRPAGHIEGRKYDLPADKHDKILLNRISQGGPAALSSLVTYLARAHTNSART